jgi:hypothetical protein
VGENILDTYSFCKSILTTECMDISSKDIFTS